MHEEIAAQGIGDWDLFNSQLVLRLLDRKNDAIALSKDFLKKPEQFPPVRQEAFRKTLEFCASEMTAKELISSVGYQRRDLLNAHLSIALTVLADGNRSEARNTWGSV